MGEMIQIVCRRCRTPFAAAASLRGQTMYCPACNSAVRIEESPSADALPASAPAGVPPVAASSAKAPEPATAEQGTGEPRLRLARDRIASGRGRTCPKCGANMGDTDIVCALCGWNTRTNRSMADVARRTEVVRELVSLLTKVTLVAGLGWLVWAAVLRDWWRSRPRAPEIEPPPGDSAATSTAAAASAERTVSMLAAPTPEMETAARQEVVRRMDERFPRIADGEETIVAMRNGRILRGRFERRSDRTGFTVAAADGTVESHPFAELQPASRLRCDDAYRAREIEREVDRKLGR
ncbi:MAG: hypothetical protein N2652_07085 [Kiritimatiellae bacterium]|nr:hypothetical protein [Kiritimatiellia bacterium]